MQLDITAGGAQGLRSQRGRGFLTIERRAESCGHVLVLPAAVRPCPAQLCPFPLPALAGTPVSKTEYSPTSVVGSPGMAGSPGAAQQGAGLEAPQESTGSAGSASAASPDRHPTEEDSGEEEASVAAPSPSPPSPQCRVGNGTAASADEGLAHLRLLGRQLLQGWAEAVGALAKLPGVGSMRVDTLADRLATLARDASPAAAAAAQQAADAGGGSVAPATDGAAAGGPSGGGSRGGTPPLAAPAGPPPSELAGPNSKQPQAYSDPIDMFAIAAKSAHLPYPELLHAFAASAEGAPLSGSAWVFACAAQGWARRPVRACSAA